MECKACNGTGIDNAIPEEWTDCPVCMGYGESIVHRRFIDHADALEMSTGNLTLAQALIDETLEELRDLDPDWYDSNEEGFVCYVNNDAYSYEVVVDKPFLEE